MSSQPRRIRPITHGDRVEAGRGVEQGRGFERAARWPIFGTLSIVTPMLVAVAWLVVERTPSIGEALNGYLGLMMLAALLVGSGMAAVAGITLGGFAVFRRERAWWLGVLGLLVNSWLLLELAS